MNTVSKKPIMFGIKVVFGVPSEIKPIWHEFPGELGLELSNRDVARFTYNGKKFILLDKGDHWELAPENWTSSRRKLPNGLERTAIHHGA